MAIYKGQNARKALRQYRKDGSLRRASALAKRLAEKENHPLGLILEMVSSLIETADFELAQQLLESNHAPSNPRWIAQSLKLKWVTDFDPSILDLECDFMMRFSHLHWVRSRYLSKLLALKKFRDAIHFVGVEGLIGSQRSYFRMRLSLALHLKWAEEAARSVTVILSKEQEILPGKEQVAVGSLLLSRLHVLGGYAEPCLEKLDKFLEACDVQPSLGFTQLRLRRALEQGSWPTVRAILEEHPEYSEDRAFVHASTWLSVHLGDLSRARSIFRRQSKFLNYRSLRPCRVGELIKIDEKNFRGGAGIRLFTVVKNEMRRVSWFIEYYRALGVDEFFFVDNGSTDGTREALMSHEDVHVFFTDTAYAEGASGMVWVNELMTRFGTKGWNLYVDVDEALVFPACERNGLEYLTRYMEKNKQEVLPAFMLDMHAKRGLNNNASGLMDRDFLSAYPFYLNDFTVRGKGAAPYYRVDGGGRDHLFGENVEQTKVPLLSGGRGIRCLLSSHAISPAAVSDVSGALLHFRMTDQFVAEVKKDLTQNTRGWLCNVRQLSYLSEEYGESGSDADMPVSKFYENSDSLLRSGLISAPRRYLDRAP